MDADGLPPEVAAELVGRVAELERTQREEDVAGFLALFAPSAVWVTGGGQRLVGLDVIGEFTRAALPGAFADGASVTYEPRVLRLLDDRVAVTGVEQTYLDRDGAVTGRGLPTYVWRRDEEGWRIVVGQNTTVPEA